MSDKQNNEFPTEKDLYSFAFWEGVYYRTENDGRLSGTGLRESMERWQEYKEGEIKIRNIKAEEDITS